MISVLLSPLFLELMARDWCVATMLQSIVQSEKLVQGATEDMGGSSHPYWKRVGTKNRWGFLEEMTNAAGKGSGERLMQQEALDTWPVF